ncbi:hypothetical protein TNCV_3469461 [Trichonephila clavipes]|nr:hypothetical protein TNCV_3469461 [Trichonephila clavipes]
MDGIVYHSSTPLVLIATPLRCWSQLSFLTFKAYPQPYFSRIMRDYTCHVLSKGSSSITRLNFFPGSPDLSLIENMWSMVAQQMTQITPPAATPEQLWQPVESA